MMGQRLVTLSLTVYDLDRDSSQAHWQARQGLRPSRAMAVALQLASVTALVFSTTP